MKKLRFILALFLSLTVTLSCIPIVAYSATEQEVKATEVNLGGGIYKLVFAAKSPGGYNSFNVAFSYDNSVIVPVTTSAPYDSVTITDGATTQTPFRLLDSSFIVPSAKWSVDGVGGRTAFLINTLSFSGGTNSSEFFELFEFYYKLKDGKTIDDLNKTTFRFEDGRNADSMLEALVASAGIILNSDGTTYYWGAASTQTNIIPDSNVILTFTNVSVIEIDADSSTQTAGTTSDTDNAIVDTDEAISGVDVAGNNTPGAVGGGGNSIGFSSEEGGSNAWVLLVILIAAALGVFGFIIWRRRRVKKAE